LIEGGQAKSVKFSVGKGEGKRGRYEQKRGVPGLKTAFGGNMG